MLQGHRATYHTTFNLRLLGVALFGTHRNTDYLTGILSSLIVSVSNVTGSVLVSVWYESEGVAVVSTYLNICDR